MPRPHGRDLQATVVLFQIDDGISVQPGAMARDRIGDGAGCELGSIALRSIRSGASENIRATEPSRAVNCPPGQGWKRPGLTRESVSKGSKIAVQRR